MPNLITRLFHSRDKPDATNAASPALAFFFGGSAAGKMVSPRTAMQMTTVYACVRVIAETVASLPLHVFRSVELGSEKAVDHGLYRLLHDEPNSEMTSFQFREAAMTHLLLWGNSYSQIIRNGRGQVVGLYPLLPERMTVDRNERGRLSYIYCKDGTDFLLKAEDVLHIPGLGFDGIVGNSPIAMERNAIGLGIAAEEFGSKFFSNGANPSGVLSHPGTIKDTAGLRQSWMDTYGGSGNAGKIAVLEENMKFERISIPNNEAQFLESRKFQVNEICRIYRVPPHMVGDLEHATFSNIEHESINFGVYTIRPWLVRIEQAMNRALIAEREKGDVFVQFNLDGLMRGSYRERMQGYAIGRQNGWLSANDIRSLENQNLLTDDEGGNAYLVNGNMVPIRAIPPGGSVSGNTQSDPNNTNNHGDENDIAETGSLLSLTK